SPICCERRAGIGAIRRAIASYGRSAIAASPALAALFAPAIVRRLLERVVLITLLRIGAPSPRRFRHGRWRPRFHFEVAAAPFIGIGIDARRAVGRLIDAITVTLRHIARRRVDIWAIFRRRIDR